ncbi:MAG: hypothetical protein R3Y33_08490, partial [Clostridia bacterium]
MLEFVIQKILSKKWMILSLIIGNILLVGISSSNPIYSQAILQKTLNTNLSNYMLTENEYPGNVNMTATIKKESSKDFTFLPYMEEVAENISEEFGTEQL